MGILKWGLFLFFLVIVIELIKLIPAIIFKKLGIKKGLYKHWKDKHGY